MTGIKEELTTMENSNEYFSKSAIYRPCIEKFDRKYNFYDKCQGVAEYGPIFGYYLHCKNHKKPNEYKQNMPKCKYFVNQNKNNLETTNCCKYASYGTASDEFPTVCKICILKNSGFVKNSNLKLFEKIKCKFCQYEFLLHPERQTCINCSIYNFKLTELDFNLIQKDKLYRICLLLQLENIEFTRDELFISGGQRRKADLVLRSEKLILILQIDSHQRESANKLDDKNKIIHIYETISANPDDKTGKNILFVRYNKDAYTDADGIYCADDNYQRELFLIKFIKSICEKKFENIEDKILICYLFYNSFSTDIILIYDLESNEIIDYYNNLN